MHSQLSLFQEPIVKKLNLLKSRLIGLSTASLLLLSPAAAHAADIVNSGFENGFDGWSVPAAAKADVKASGDAKKGDKSVKITGAKGLIEQQITVAPNSHYELTAYVKGSVLMGVKSGTQIYFDRRKKKGGWKKMTIRFNTDDVNNVKIFGGYNGGDGRYDDFVLTYKGPQNGQAVSANVVSKSSGGTGLSPDLSPGENFDLLGWKLSIPSDKDNNGKSDTISEINLAKGYEDSEYFYTADDGGMVFKCPIKGHKTSQNTSYTRTELREMLRRGNKDIKTKTSDGTPNKNSWVFSSAPESAKKAAGGIDGVMEATLAVNHVTTTGKDSQVGRVIIGQIHGEDDEPIRLYYRKLPGNTHGSIYAAHESHAFEKDIYYEMIGTRSKSAPNNPAGIRLNEKFSYKIDAKGNFLYVTISQYGQILNETTIDMTNSGYDVANDNMYFKAGVYNQNKSGDPDDYVQATFYRLKVTHESYEAP